MKNKSFTIQSLYGAMLLLFTLAMQSQVTFAQCGQAANLKPTVSASNVCSGNYVYVYATGLPVSRWVYRDNHTGNWTVYNSSSDNFSLYLSASVTTVRTFKAVLSTVSCANDTTDGVDVTIVPATYGNNNAIRISSSIGQVCSGGQVTFRLMDGGAQVTQWIFRDNGGNWQQYASTSSQSLTIQMPYVSIQTTREYRVLVKDPANCRQDSSDGISIIINPTTAGNNSVVKPILTQQQICGGTQVNIQVEWPLEIGDWLYKDANGSSWNVFSTNSSSVYDYNTTIPATTLRSYRVILRNPGNCSADTSEDASLLINASIRRNLTNVFPRITGSNPDICAGNSQSFTLQGYGSRQWYYRDSINGVWNNFSSSTSPSLGSSSSLLTDLVREVRVVINNSSLSCSFDTTGSVFYKIKANKKGITSTALPYVNTGEFCAGAQIQVNLGNGLSINNWLYRNNNTGNWTNAGSGSTYYDYNTNVTTNTLRSYRAVVSYSNLCRIDTTAEVQVLIKTPVPGGRIEVTPTAEQQAYCIGAQVYGSVSLNTGLAVTKWIFRDNQSGAWADLPGQVNSNSFYDYTTGTLTAQTYRSYKALVKNMETFRIDTSNEFTVVINPVIRGNLPVTPTSTQTFICNQNNISLNMVTPIGYSINTWLGKEAGSNFWSTFGGSSSNPSDYVNSTAASKTYRVILFNQASCRYDTSNAISFNIHQRAGRDNTAILPVSNASSVCSGTSFSVNTTSANGLSVVRWMYRDNNSAWQNVANSSFTYNVSSSNTRVLSPTTRELKIVINNNNTCTTDTSAAVSVAISPLVNGIVTGYAPVSNSTVNCAGSSVNINLNNYTGTVQKWVYRDNSGPWTEFAFNTSSSSLYENPYVGSVTNRDYRAFLIRQGTCIIDTSQTLSLQIRPYSYGTAPSVQPIANAVTICSGNTASAYISGYSGTVQKWIYRNNHTGDWRELTNSTASSSFSETNVQVLSTTTRTYRAILITGGCSYDTTSTVNIQINPRSYGHAPAVTLTSSQGSFCSGSSISVNAISGTMPSGSSVRRWMYMDNMSGNWFEIPSSSSTFLNHSNSYVPVSTTRSYRILVNNSNACSYDSSSVYSVTVNPSTFGNIAVNVSGNVNMVCNASTNPNLSISGSYTGTVLKWIMNSNNNGWEDFGYSTSSSSMVDYNVNVAYPVNRLYRAIITNTTNCSIDTTNATGITISPLISGTLGTIAPQSGRTTSCYAKPVPVNLSMLPSGYSVVRWLISDQGGDWNSFYQSTTSVSITDNNTFVPVPVSRSYRVLLSNTNTCQADTTAAFTVLIKSRNANIGYRNITPTVNSANVCPGSTIGLSVNPGTGNDVMRWTFSDNGGPWYDVYNSLFANNFNHNLNRVTTLTSRLYRAIITDTSTCDFDSTNAVGVTIRPITWGTDTSMVISGADTICTGSSVSLGISPGSGNSVLKWIYAINGGNWQTFTQSTSTNNFTDNATVYPPGTTKRYTPIVLKGAVCRYDTLTKTKDVFIKNKTFGSGSVQATVQSNDTVCSGSSVSVNVSGIVERWLFSTNKQTWEAIPNSNQSFFSQQVIVPTSSWRYYMAILNTGSCNADSSRFDSVFIKVYSGGTLAVAPTSPNALVCAGNSVSLSFSLPGASIMRWIYSDNNIDWVTFSTSSSSNITDNNTYVSSITTRRYRVITDYKCGYDTSLAVQVTLSPKLPGTDNTKTPTSSTASVCAGSAISNIQVAAGSGNSIVRWLSRDNGGNWMVILNGNTSSFTDYNTYVNSTITRDYAAIINNNSTCRLDTTAKLTVTINPVVLGNNNNRTPVVPASACMGSNYQVSMNVASDTSIIRFFYNTNGGAWIDRGYMNPTTNTSFSQFAAAQASTYTMGYRAVLYKAGNCRIDTTAAAFVSISPRSYGNDNTLVPTSSFGSSACAGNAFNLFFNAGSGNTLQYWIYSEDGGPYQAIYSSNSTLSQTVYTQTGVVRKYRALVVKGSNCSIDTSADLTISIVPLVYGIDTVSKTTVNGNKGICVGSPVSLSAGNLNGSQVSTWFYRNGYTGSWNNMYNSNTNISDQNTNVGSSIDRQYALLLYKSGQCRYDTTTINDTAFISTRTLGTDSTLLVTSTGNSFCTGNPVSLNTSGIGSHTIQSWLYNINNGPWMVLYSGTTTSLTDYNTNVSVQQTRNYRLLVRKANACAIDSGAIKSVTISPRTNGSDPTLIPTAANNAICSGGVASITLNTGGQGSIQKWLQRTDGGNWTDWAYTSASSVNDYNTTTSTGFIREYRAVVMKGNGCAIDTSAPVSVMVSAIGYGNQNSVVPVPSASSVCSGSLVSISLGSFNGNAVKHWMFRDMPTDNWTIINMASTVVSDANTITATTISRQYRALVVNASGCSFDTTAAATVVINPILNGVHATSAQSSQTNVCTGNVINIFINTPSGYTLQQWLYRDAGGSWQALNAGTSSSVNDFNTLVASNTIRDYRVLMNNASGCSIDSSGIASVSINLITQGNNAAVIPVASNPIICSGSPAIVGITGFSGSVVQWLYRDSSVYGWTVINNNGYTLYHTSTTVSYTRVREYRAILYNPVNCSYDTSGVGQVTINPQLQGNANNVVPTSTSAVYCSGTPITVSATGFINGGVVTAWIFSDNNGLWIPIASSNNSMITHNNTTVSALVSRRYRALVHTGCSTDTTAALTITLDAYPAKPLITRSGSSDTLNCSATAATYQWKLNGGNIAGANAKTFIATQNGNYTVEIGNASNCKTTSDAFNFIRSGLLEASINQMVQVYPNPTSDGRFTIQLDEIPVDEVKIQVSDVLGKTVYSGVHQVHKGGFTIDLTNQPSGIYWLNMNMDGTTVCKRIVVNR